MSEQNEPTEPEMIQYDLSEFQDEDSNFLPRTQTKTIQDLERVINLKKPQAVLVKFAELVDTNNQYRFIDLYLDYIKTFNQVKEYNASIVQPEDPDLQIPYKEYPTAPTEYIKQTPEQILEPYLRDIFKRDRSELVNKITVTVDSMVFDGDEESQTRMARALAALDPLETTTWVLNDNSVAYPTREQLKQALRLSGEAQTNLWLGE